MLQCNIFEGRGADVSVRSPDPAGLDEEALDRALEYALRRESELAEQIDALGSERQALKQEVALLERLRALRRPEEYPLETTGASPGGPVMQPVTSTASGRPPHPAVQAAIEELEAAGKPLHISEIMRLLESRGVEIPGAGAQANLIAHLSRNDNIVRPSRGIYALSSWGITDSPRLKRATRRRARGRGRKASSTENQGE